MICNYITLQYTSIPYTIYKCAMFLGLNSKDSLSLISGSCGVKQSDG